MDCARANAYSSSSNEARAFRHSQMRSLVFLGIHLLARMEVVMRYERMADILDQADNDLDLYDGEMETHYSERDVLGEDDENELPIKQYFQRLKSYEVVAGTDGYNGFPQLSKLRLSHREYRDKRNCGTVRIDGFRD
ncbi:unnamed protein product [Toxocara canis]|uniref:DUF2052 domain-containing protein n=1 Tax=Toxocara canis TaxID=6265 RepID=A0A183UAI7_TOXCA|nr:unnamed protein product [Toxocara canis]